MFALLSDFFKKFLPTKKNSYIKIVVKLSFLSYNGM